jgi:flavin reductase (DIM6/NTAB) family NADH-FMN oxidoreductase RutF
MRIDVADLTNNAAYKILTDTVVPRPVAWISTLGPDGVRNLAPYSFFQAIGGAPPTVIVSVARHADGDRKDSAANAMAAGELVINIVSEDLLDAMNATSGDYPIGVDEFDVAGVTSAPCEHVSAPRVAESPVSFECRVSSSIAVGREPDDYVLLICEIVAFHVRDGLLQDGRIDPELLRPICRLGGTGFAGLGEILQIPRPRIART